MNPGILLVAAACLCVGVANAQPYPTKTVRLVVPFSPGGGVEAIARVLSQKLSETWRHQLLVDNRPGGGTTIGTDIVAKAAPDGYTLLLTNSGLAISAALYPKLQYDTGKDLLPIMEVLRAPFVIVVPAASSMKSVKDLVAAGRAKPAGLALANGGIGSGSHLAGVLFGSMTRVTFNHIPYKGGGPAIPDVIANRVQAMVTTPLTAEPHAHSGRLRILAVTSAKRAAGLPGVPTVAESGVEGYDVSTWYMLLAPARTPQPIVAQLHRDAAAALKQPDAVKILGSGGAEVVVSSPEEAGKLLRGELQLWASVIKQAGVKLED